MFNKALDIVILQFYWGLGFLVPHSLRHLNVRSSIDDTVGEAQELWPCWKCVTGGRL